jgi:hypothetical protein
MPFGNDAIAVVTNGLVRDTGSFAERLVSHGLIGDILTAFVPSNASRWFFFFERWK